MKIERRCVICKKSYWTILTKNQIKSGRGKACSLKCRYILVGIQKRRGEFRKCIKCDKDFWCRPSEDKKGSTRSYCSKKCLGTEKKERKISTDGYWLIHTPHGEMKEQRWIMCQHLNRLLLSTEIVHHINLDKFDNRLENLKIVSRAEHNTIHFKGRIPWNK